MNAWGSWIGLMRNRVAKQEEGVPWFVEDKVLAYEFVKKLNVQTPALFGCLKCPDQLNGMDLPEKFVCKPANLSSSKGVMVLKYKKNNIYINRMSGEEIALSEIVNIQNNLKKEVESTVFGGYELLVEEWLIGEGQAEGDIPYDYKFFCYGEKIVYVAQYDRNSKKNSVSWFLGEFESDNLNGRIECDWRHVSKGIAKIPSCSVELLAIVKRLSKELKTPFVRVDMYATINGPVFGEFTLTPGAAYYGEVYKYTDQFDNYCGLLWQAEKINIEINGKY